MRPNERGSVTLFILFMLPFVLALCGVGIDGARLIAAQRSVATAVDAAASAGSNGISETEWRESNILRLDPARAESQARDNLAAQPEAPQLESVGITATTERITVEASMQVHLTLLRLFVYDNPIVHATGTATPRRGA